MQSTVRALQKTVAQLTADRSTLFASLALIAIGLLQIVGTPWPRVTELASATGASPSPRVCTTSNGWNGYEWFSLHTTLEWTDAQGGTHAHPITREDFDAQGGPFIRRRAFGNFLAFAPFLSAQEQQRLAEQTYCKLLPQRKPTDTHARSVRLRIDPRPGLASERQFTVEWPCP